MTIGRVTLREKLLRARRLRPFGQFGTTDDECTDNGALGCTHTVWRFIAFIYTGKWYSHDQLSRLSGYPCGGGPENRGMRIGEAQQLCRALKLPYVYRANLTSSQLLNFTGNGPVVFAMLYGKWPAWKGYKGIFRKGPWARPYGAAGRNQFNWSGSHAALLLGYKRIIRDHKFVRNDCYVLEPNHDSPARPENVPYDVVTQTQLNVAYRATVTDLHWTSTMAFVPTRQPTFPGGLS